MGVFRDHRLFRLKFHFTVRLSRDSSPRKQSWPLMVYYFSTITWCSRDNRFSGIVATKFLRLFMDVHHRTRRMSSSLSLSFFYLHRRIPLVAARSLEEWVLSLRILDSLAPLCFACFALSLVVSFYLFFTLSLRLFFQTRLRFRLLSLACLSDGGNERDSNRGESKGSLDWEERETNVE